MNSTKSPTCGKNVEPGISETRMGRLGDGHPVSENGTRSWRNTTQFDMSLAFARMVRYLPSAASTANAGTHPRGVRTSIQVVEAPRSEPAVDSPATRESSQCGRSTVPGSDLPGAHVRPGAVPVDTVEDHLPVRSPLLRRAVGRSYPVGGESWWRPWCLRPRPVAAGCWSAVPGRRRNAGAVDRR